MYTSKLDKLSEMINSEVKFNFEIIKAFNAEIKKVKHNEACYVNYDDVYDIHNQILLDPFKQERIEDINCRVNYINMIVKKLHKSVDVKLLDDIVSEIKSVDVRNINRLDKKTFKLLWESRNILTYDKEYSDFEKDVLRLALVNFKGYYNQEDIIILTSPKFDSILKSREHELFRYNYNDNEICGFNYFISNLLDEDEMIILDRNSIEIEVIRNFSRVEFSAQNGKEVLMNDFSYKIDIKNRDNMYLIKNKFKR